MEHIVSEALKKPVTVQEMLDRAPGPMCATEVIERVKEFTATIDVKLKTPVTNNG